MILMEKVAEVLADIEAAAARLPKHASKNHSIRDNRCQEKLQRWQDGRCALLTS